MVKKIPEQRDEENKCPSSANVSSSEKSPKNRKRPAEFFPLRESPSPMMPEIVRGSLATMPTPPLRLETPDETAEKESTDIWATLAELSGVEDVDDVLDEGTALAKKHDEITDSISFNFLNQSLYAASILIKHKKAVQLLSSRNAIQQIEDAKFPTGRVEFIKGFLKQWTNAFLCSSVIPGALNVVKNEDELQERMDAVLSSVRSTECRNFHKISKCIIFQGDHIILETEFLKSYLSKKYGVHFDHQMELFLKAIEHDINKINDCNNLLKIKNLSSESIQKTHLRSATHFSRIIENSTAMLDQESSHRFKSFLSSSKFTESKLLQQLFFAISYGDISKIKDDECIIELRKYPLFEYNGKKVARHILLLLLQWHPEFVSLVINAIKIIGEIDSILHSIDENSSKTKNESKKNKNYSLKI